MSEIETLIYIQQSKIATLSTEIEELVKHLKDFETAAHVWKKGYEDMERNYKAKLANAEQVIESLRQELMNTKNSSS